MAVEGLLSLKLCAACSMLSSFSSELDLIGMIFGLQRTSLRLPFSEYTSPALGSTSCSSGFPLAACESCSSDMRRAG
eukprot:CAMPEP_0115851452 /NCGR_PEP_ID=MMETSP0287-20121206/12490_1 /TAXON_ID=412157 /ORGANISM="Chrysochromulina rotalis, Strain UIO044" /LENGTH=76 /DNA_ID=CAMNT_0003305487 /DNA_START=332 /DNA_END=559 /DNA_ORIENTATION=-